MRWNGRIALVAVGVVHGALVFGQQTLPVVSALHPVVPMPAYEVATIKPAEPTPLGMTASRYIQWAFDLPHIKGVVLNGPEWITQNQFRIEGKPSEADHAAMEKMSSGEAVKMERRMGQALLADRFQLKMHFETREMAIFKLEVANGGSKMTKSTGDASAQGRLNLEGSQKGVQLAATNTAMSLLASALQNYAVDRPVLDATGLTGRFDFKIQFAADGRQFSGVIGSSDSDAGSPSVVTALRELGLQLVSAKAPVEVVVVDGIEMPSEN